MLTQFLSVLCLQEKRKKYTRNDGLTGKRFDSPSLECIMSGVLLSPGPVATLNSVHRLSRVFNKVVNKEKFMAAATKLNEMEVGDLVTVNCGDKWTKTVDVFIKKLPEEMGDVIVDDEVLCTQQEYQQRFFLSPPLSIDDRLQNSLVEQGLVKAEYFTC